MKGRKGNGTEGRIGKSSTRNSRQITALRIIDLCRTISDKSIDPFEIDIEELFNRLRPFFNESLDLEDTYLDIYAVLGLSDVISQQGDWIKHRSSLLYYDPLLILLKIETLQPKDLADIFTRAWHPILEMERISMKGLREALDYWNNLQDLDARRVGIDVDEVAIGAMDVQSLVRLGFISEDEFTSALERLWIELKKKAGEGDLDYWMFVDCDSYEETVKKAYMVSFLVSYGYTTLKIEPLEEKITLKPFQERQDVNGKIELSSIPINLSYDEWRKRRRENDR